VTSSQPWYRDAFEHGYLEVYPHRDAAAARAEVEGLVRGGLEGRVLDLGCGFGRHTLAMRRQGLSAVGLDLSADLLERAEELEGRLVRGDMRALPFTDRAFDGVTMLFSSFGYFDERENAMVLDELARLLRPGGMVVLDLMNADRIRATLVPESRKERDGRVLIERRSLEEWGRRVTKAVTLLEPDGSERSWREDVRLYGPEELRALLNPRGLDVARVEGDFDGSEATPDSPRHIVWARRR